MGVRRPRGSRCSAAAATVAAKTRPESGTQQNLTNKWALVTGGSRGIGAGIGERLARDGADVALTYVSNPDRAHAVRG